MIVAAIKITIVYLLIQLIEMCLGWQCLNRPIVFGPIIGLVLGDIETGIILGASLESIFMGISAIGGSIPSDPATATVLTVAYTVLLGENTEAGLALAIPIGTAMISFGGIFTPFFASLAPYWEKLAVEGKIRKLFNQSILVSFLMYVPNALVMFLAVAFGLEGLNSFLSALPAWVMTGFGAASTMMLGIGIAILTSMIWTPTEGVFFFLGYILIKFLGLSTLPVAVIGVVIAVTIFLQDKSVIEVKNEIQKTLAAGGSQSSEEEGFFA